MRIRTLVLICAVLGVVAAMAPVVATTGAAPAAANAAYRAGRLAGTAVVPSASVEYDDEPLAVRAHSVGRPAAEPTLGVDPKGNVFYAAGAFDGPLNPANPFNESQTIPTAPRTMVLRSSDRGASWKSVSPTIPTTDNPIPPVTADPMVYVDDVTGRVFNPELYAGCTYLNFSDDQGATWLTNPVACGSVVNDHQTVATGPPPAALKPLMVAYPNVLYYCFNRVADSSCGRSFDGGLTFTPSAPAFLGYDPAAGGLCGGLHGHVATDSEGRLFMPKGHCGAPWLAVSEDAGTTWTRVKVSPSISAAAAHLAVAVDDADNVYFLWWDAARRLPWLAVSTDHGRTFGTPMMVAPPGVQEVNFPVLEAGAAGRIAITFPGTTSARPPAPPESPFEPVTGAAASDTKRPWNHYMVVSTDANKPDPLFLSTTANSPSDPVHRGDCGPGRCGALWDFEDIVVSPVDGRFWAAVADGCTAIQNCNKPGGAAPGILEMPVGDGLAVEQISGPSLRPKGLAQRPPGSAGPRG